MLKDIKFADHFKEAVEEADDIRVKELDIRKYKINTQHEELQRSLKEQETNRNLDLTGMSETDREKTKEDIKNYMLGARDSQTFLKIDDFKGKIPMLSRNLIFIGGESGNGKSTLTANLAYGAACQLQKVLVITNEENTSDVFNRLTCLRFGWNYSCDHSTFTDNQMNEFMKYVDIWTRNVNVIDDNYQGSTGVTTTLEGIQTILTKLVEKEIKYDLILIDYYQNIDYSSKNPTLNEYSVQERLVKFLDSFKNRYGCPIVVLGQLKPYDEEKTPFKIRIEGRKSIYNSCTTAVEVQRDSANSRTRFIIKKSRFPQSLNSEILVGFDRGRFVPYTSDFALRAEADKQTKLTKSIVEMAMGKNAKK